MDMTKTITPFIHSGQPILDRHSEYDLDDSMPVPAERLEQLLGDILLTTPSAFNAQPVRICLLTEAAHRRHWDLIGRLLRDKIGEERYAGGTAEKIDSFHRAAGTVLFFDDTEVTKALIEKYPSYEEQFPRWAEQVQGSHQYAAWLGLVELGFGANLQHYNGLNDDQVKADAGVPESYRFVAELVFGGRRGTSGLPKPKRPLSETLRVLSQ